MIGGQEASVKPGQVQSHAGSAPLAIAFDPGDGSEPTRQTLESGVYKVGIQMRPHFKYMGASFTLSLVGKLDKKAMRAAHTNVYEDVR